MLCAVVITSTLLFFTESRCKIGTWHVFPVCWAPRGARVPLVAPSPGPQIELVRELLHDFGIGLSAGGA
jgi:hypothetical protein